MLSVLCAEIIGLRFKKKLYCKFVFSKKRYTNQFSFLIIKLRLNQFYFFIVQNILFNTMQFVYIFKSTYRFCCVLLFLNLYTYAQVIVFLCASLKAFTLAFAATSSGIPVLDTLPFRLLNLSFSARYSDRGLIPAQIVSSKVRQPATSACQRRSQKGRAVEFEIAFASRKSLAQNC